MRIFVRSTAAMLATGLLALCIIVASNIWLGERAQGYSQSVIATTDVQALAVDLRASLQAAESSQRGYLYTGNQIYLAPYDQAKTRAENAAAALPSALASYPDLEPAVERLLAIVRDKIIEMDQSIAFKRDRKEAEALELLKTNQGKLLMDEANVFVTGILLAADRRLADLVSEQTNNALWLRFVSVLGGLVILAVVGGALILVFRYTRDLALARDQLRHSNERLEERVAARTAELASASEDMRRARDRAEILLSEVNHRVANSLTLVSSFIGMQSRSLSDQATRNALAEAQARVQAVAMVHRRLYDSNDVREVALDEYLIALLDQFTASIQHAGELSLRYDLDPLRLPTDSSVSLGVIATEWVMNAAKYAYPDRRGEVRIILKTNGSRGVLRVEDDGVGRDNGAPAQGTGVGSRIVSAMAANIGGAVDYSSNGPGTSARLSFQLT